MFKRILVGLAVCSLGACATIIEGTNQEIAIDSNPRGAKCELERRGEVIGRVETPETIVVKKTKHDVDVTCDLEGYHISRAHLKSKIEDATWGNIVLGGLVGWGVDSATGSDNKYEKYVTITMVPLSQPAPTEDQIFEPVFENEVSPSDDGAGEQAPEEASDPPVSSE